MKKLLLIGFIGMAAITKAQTTNLQWAKSFELNQSGLINSVEVDAIGNVYSTGYFIGTGDFDPGAATYTLTNISDRDIFISKLDPSGNFLWAKRQGSSNADNSKDIAVDASGNVYTTGYFAGTVDFDPGAATYTLAVGSTNQSDIFVSKLDANGDFVWAKKIGNSTSVEIANSIAVDAFANVYITGTYSATVDFDPGVGTTTLTTSGGDDIFIVKLDANGNFIWAKNMGGSNRDQAYSIAVDASSNIYTTGFFRGTADFDPNATTYTLTSYGNNDIFISKLDNNGNFIWAKNIGGSCSEEANDITVDGAGNVYTTGYYSCTVDFNPNAGTNNITSFMGNDVFILKLDAAGNYVWAKSFGYTGGETGTSIKTDGAGNVYSCGYFEYTPDFDPGTGTYTITSAGGFDAYLLKLDANGNFIWANSIGSVNDDRGYSVAVDASNNVYSGGIYQATCDFDPTSGTYSMTAAPMTTNLFVLKTGQSTTTGIENLINKNRITMFPNPTHGVFTIELNEPSKISITNSLGQIIFNESRTEGANVIELQHEASGLYFITVAGKDVQHTYKLIKE